MSLRAAGSWLPPNMGAGAWGFFGGSFTLPPDAAERVSALAKAVLARAVPLGLEALDAFTKFLPHLEKWLWYIVMEVNAGGHQRVPCFRGQVCSTRLTCDQRRTVSLQAVVIPKVALKQVAALCTLRSALIVVTLVHSTWQAIVDRITPYGRERLRLRRAMSAAKTYAAWKR